MWVKPYRRHNSNSCSGTFPSVIGSPALALNSCSQQRVLISYSIGDMQISNPNPFRLNPPSEAGHHSVTSDSLLGLTIQDLKRLGGIGNAHDHQPFLGIRRRGAVAI